ncbi:MAG TPA: outer membrane protein assembly factor BamC [Rubrivivax sp.]|nr:outer membrane protein assembly factor BamC [Rubrivivax sp.]
MNRIPGGKPSVLCLLALPLVLAGCTFSSAFSGDRVDYRGAATKTNPLEVPPDLTQLKNDGRYQKQGGTISASAIPAAGVTRTNASVSSSVAPGALGEFKVERDGARRWLSVPKNPEQVWPQLVSFWQDLGFTLVKNDAATGVMETNWAENRAKLPQDIVRRTIGTLLDSVYSTGELDQYRTRIERTPTGSEIFVTHKGMEEVYTSPQKDATRWQPRPPDEQMESEMLSRMLVKLGAADTVARSAVANPVTAEPVPQRARVLSGQPGATLEVDDGLDRAWRRVGIALDRSGFTVEDRDRAAGLYFVRYVDPKTAGQDATPGFFAKLFGASTDSSGAALKYQVSLKSDGTKTIVAVLNSQGAPDAGENSKRIVTMLAEELK